MSTVKTYNVDSGDTTNLVLKTNGVAALTINGTTGAVTSSGSIISPTITNPTITGTISGGSTISSPVISSPTISNPVVTNLNLNAGTASAAPIDFAAGTNLTTAIPGAVEYDGKVFFATPQGTQRGVIPGAQFFRLNAGLAGANVNTVQNLFGVGVTLSSATVYEFEALYVLSKSLGATSHNLGFGFGGTATVNNIMYQAIGGYVASATPTGQLSIGTVNNGLGFMASTTANTTAYATVATAAVSFAYAVRGTISVNAGGTLIPQYTLSAAPGGAYTTAAGSYFLIYPIGASGANTSVGTWA